MSRCILSVEFSFETKRDDFGERFITGRCGRWRGALNRFDERSLPVSFHVALLQSDFLHVAFLRLLDLRFALKFARRRRGWKCPGTFDASFHLPHVATEEHRDLGTIAV